MIRNDSSATTKTTTTTPTISTIHVGAHVGSGSYGTVHECTVVTTPNDNEEESIQKGICKRAWTESELVSQSQQQTQPIKKQGDAKVCKERAKRCQSYFQVEQHCWNKLNGMTFDQPQPQRTKHDETTTIYRGTSFDNDDDPQPSRMEWMVFDFIGNRANDGPALTLDQAMQTRSRSRNDKQQPSPQEEQQRNPLHHVQHELGLSSSRHENGGATFEETLDVVIQSLLRILVEVHEANIVHRDVKPANLLLNPQTNSLVLIDFGSAADMDPVKTGMFGVGRRVGLDLTNDVKENGFSSLFQEQVTAISPIYAAPELFVEWDKNPLEFDVFSAALVMCQCLFRFLDERTDAGFHQQLVAEENCDLDAWLARELSSTIRPLGLEEGLEYLASRPGLWQLLKHMFHPNPQRRISSKEAYQTFSSILLINSGSTSTTEETTSSSTTTTEPSIQFDDGPFFASVLVSLDTCDLLNDPEVEDDEASQQTMTDESSLNAPSFTRMPPITVPRPLHFVATFDRAESLGLVLSEVDDSEDDIGEEILEEWKWATQNAKLGEVFIKEIVPGGQAETMGIFDVGDRLRSVGELPVGEGGFERAVELLGGQPRSAKTVVLHFDRKPRTAITTIDESSNDASTCPPHLAKLIDQGAWSSKGRRKAQEDAFVLHEFNCKQNADYTCLIAGVFDGHGGMAASKTASQLLPSLYVTEMSESNDAPKALASAWDLTCHTYRNGCDGENGECIADYDPIEGILFAETGSKDLIAGTTAAAAVLCLAPSNNDGIVGVEQVTILNCGDSRTLLIGPPASSDDDNTTRKSRGKKSVIYFASRDHKPSDQLEADRLQAGRKQGLDYSLPQCSLSRWWITCGDYQYAVSRSLEGSFATSKGLVSDPDIVSFSMSTTKSEGRIIAIASDGLFDVLDNESVGRELLHMRGTMNISAADAAKNLCSMALQKGTPDNVSVVVIYLD